MAAPASNIRWIQLLLGLIAMMAISSPQYVWTLFVKSFQTTTGATLPAIQITFSILIVLQTWFSPAQGWLIDKFGPKLLIAGPSRPPRTPEFLEQVPTLRRRVISVPRTRAKRP